MLHTSISTPSVLNVSFRSISSLRELDIIQTPIFLGHDGHHTRRTMNTLLVALPRHHLLLPYRYPLLPWG